MIPQSPFSNLFKEILRNVSAPGSDLKVERKAINALHESTEAFMDKFFDAANRCAIHARRETVKPEDFSLVRWILDAFGINTLR
ncbi:Histone domain-containing protein [Meloidogyne graminicola]|uniref:Histone domain-containing protein n=1 Tax=Meloidogyne graminicola TaxID=189291 RepID=A0A8S9ZVJ3_9BILA|nr:Histone domain-containing protein [Meloidogyne graminicola]